MARLSLKEATSLLEDRGYRVYRGDAGYYTLDSNGMKQEYKDGYALVRFVKGFEEGLGRSMDIEDIFNSSYDMVVKAGVVPADKEKITVGTSRAKTSWGYCRRRGSMYLIEISEKTIKLGREAVQETMIHEILHTVPGCMNHGPKWRSEADKVNRDYNMNISRLSSKEAYGAKEMFKEDYNYLIVCDSCGAQFKRHRRSRFVNNPTSYRCQCGGKLKRVK